MQHEFQRVAIVNRGEAAMRFIHAARDFNQEHGTSLRTIALFTDPDRHSMFVREADEAVCLGPAQVLDPNTQHAQEQLRRLSPARTRTGGRARGRGLGGMGLCGRARRIRRPLSRAGHRVHRPGWRCDASHGRQDRLEATGRAGADIRLRPGAMARWKRSTAALHHAERLGYPLLIKATAGGGGHGIRLVQFGEHSFRKPLQSAQAEAFKAFGNPTVFMEQLVQRARHVEVQIIADHYGTTWAAGVRDCTIQRRHQKILEEAPSPALSPEQDLSLREAAVRLSQATGYHNAGTVEFLYEPENDRLFVHGNEHSACKSNIP